MENQLKHFGKYSKMQNAFRALRGSGLIDLSPSWIMMTTSPGSTSRINLAWIRSKAQVSLESTHAPSTLPRHSGRNPCGSRTPTSSFSVMITSEYAPSMRRSVCTRLFSPSTVGLLLQKMKDLRSLVRSIPVDPTMTIRVLECHGH